MCVGGSYVYTSRNQPNLVFLVQNVFWAKAKIWDTLCVVKYGVHWTLQATRKSFLPYNTQDSTPPRQDNTPPRQDCTPPRQNNTPPRQDNTHPRQDNTPPRQDYAPPRQNNTPPRQDNTYPRTKFLIGFLRNKGGVIANTARMAALETCPDLSIDALLGGFFTLSPSTLSRKSATWYSSNVTNTLPENVRTV